MEASTVSQNVFAAVFIPDFDISHHIIVFGVIAPEGRFNDQSGSRLYKLCIQVRLVGMEGADAVRDIQIVLLLLLRNDIDGASQCICTQTGRYYSFINFNPVYDIDRQIRQ